MLRTLLTTLLTGAALVAVVSWAAPATAAPANSAALAAAVASSCTCYYGYDEECPDGFVCTGNFSSDKCIRMEPKGGAWAGKCNKKHGDGDDLIAPCDATCEEKEDDDLCTADVTSNIVASLDLWRQATLEPGLAGGGPIDRPLATQARTVTAQARCSDYLGWRVLGLMELCRGNETVVHPATHDELEDHVIVDLRGDGCRQSSGDLCVQGLIDGLEAADMGLDPEPAVRARVEQIPGACPEGLPFGATGLGLAPIDAVVRRIVVSVGVADGREATATPTQTTE